MKHCIFILLLTLMSCSDNNTPDSETGNEKSFSFLALGDSYTIGTGVPATDSWPFLLQASLESDSIEINKLDIIAQAGWNSSVLLAEIDDENPEPHDIVSLLIGVNDQFQGRPMTTFESEFDKLLDIAFDLAGTDNRVLIVSIPDYGVTPFGAANSEKIAMDLDSYNAYMQARAEARNIPFVDITTISRQMGGGPGALATDDLHPSRLQYNRWVEEGIKPAVLDLIN